MDELTAEQDVEFALVFAEHIGTLDDYEPCNHIYRVSAEENAEFPEMAALSYIAGSGTEPDHAARGSVTICPIPDELAGEIVDWCHPNAVVFEDTWDEMGDREVQVQTMPVELDAAFRLQFGEYIHE